VKSVVSTADRSAWRRRSPSCTPRQARRGHMHGLRRAEHHGPRLRHVVWICPGSLDRCTWTSRASGSATKHCGLNSLAWSFVKTASRGSQAPTSRQASVWGEQTEFTSGCEGLCESPLKTTSARIMRGTRLILD
jgi:hypothetical protein